MSDPVNFQELPASGARRVGVVSLNSPKTLNGLSLAMCEVLAERLDAWARDPAIAAVVLKGEGEKAFCAGGDLHGIYRGMVENTSGQAWNDTYAKEFFKVEYRLDHTIHCYPKPVICWGSGIVMGGGVGLMMGAGHRIVTDTTRFAMPEISIGLFPDVAGTWMLSRMPRGIGLFLALTGAQLGASDCIHLGLADYSCGSGDLGGLLDALAALQWDADPTRHGAQIDTLLHSFDSGLAQTPGPLQRHAVMLRTACQSPDFLQVCTAVAQFSEHEDPWLQRAARTFSAGSPGSARLSFTLLRRAQHMSLADALRQEYIISLNSTVRGDLREGIRALLIDKDKNPMWNPPRHEDATEQWVEQFFQVPWPDGVPHPLVDL
ncbi:MAG: enoyl-CoA hydratase/isomerase family protein [Alcaligenaceae bacterium]|nr:enoyl-CoA hydratase/isomerase family protein [Alcaligenaceae bacterium]